MKQPEMGHCYCLHDVCTDTGVNAVIKRLVLRAQGLSSNLRKERKKFP